MHLDRLYPHTCFNNTGTLGNRSILEMQRKIRYFRYCRRLSMCAHISRFLIFNIPKFLILNSKTNKSNEFAFSYLQNKLI